MIQIIFLVVLIVSLVVMMKAKKTVPDGSSATVPLTGNEKILIWILSLINPIITGLVFYYGWKKKLPTKAKQANNITLWAFLILILLVIGLAFLGGSGVK